MSKRLIPQAPMVEKYIGLLADSPLALSQMAEPYGEDALAASLGPKTWSAVEILAHLRGCSDVWTFSILAMLAEHEPTLAPMDPRRWAKAAGYARLPYRQALDDFAAARRGLIHALRDRPLADWERRCTIGGRAHSVYSQVRRMAEHELDHLDQMRGLLNGGAENMLGSET